MPHDTRDPVIDFVPRWSDRTGIPARRFVGWLGLAPSKFYNRQVRYGKGNKHNSWVPRDFWLEGWEKRAILDFHNRYALEGYRRLAFMMLDANIVAVSPASVWRVLHGAAAALKRPDPRARARASSSRLGRTSTGTWMSATSIFPPRSTTCAACWTATAATWCTGRYANR